jgi:hypothetical protein
MGHSYILGNQLEYEVRDSICEAILERLIIKVRESRVQEAIDLVNEWYDYWYSTPPGCKELHLVCPTPEISSLIKTELESVAQDLPIDGEHLRVAKQMITILGKT